MPGIDLKASPVAELLKLIGATTVFGIGLYQYAQAQKWKRKRRESIASQFREFEADKSIQLVMTMLDWTDRPLHFRSDRWKSNRSKGRRPVDFLRATSPRSGRYGRKRTEFHFNGILDSVRETEMEFRAH
jgi:hypothetical protein